MSEVIGLKNVGLPMQVNVDVLVFHCQISFENAKAANSCPASGQNQVWIT